MARAIVFDLDLTLVRSANQESWLAKGVRAPPHAGMVCACSLPGFSSLSLSTGLVWARVTCYKEEDTDGVPEETRRANREQRKRKRKRK